MLMTKEMHNYNQFLFQSFCLLYMLRKNSRYYYYYILVLCDIKNM